MLFGGNSGTCGGCGCKSCQECTRGCTEPHTGTAFETVYTLFFEGAEAGNPGGAGSGQALEATGDVDTSDPYDGMDGTTGPWEQQVSGTFTLSPSTTRFPCRVLVRFWRSHFALGAATVPPASDVLTGKTVRVTNSAGSGGPIVITSSMLAPPDVIGRQIEPGEYLEFTPSDITLVPGAGDQSQYDAVSDGFHWVLVEAACGNDSVEFSISVKIEWNTRARQHILYGLVQECYEEQNDCDACATPGNPNARAYDTVYMTISNANVSVPVAIEGTYVLERVQRSCYYEAYIGPPVEAPRIYGVLLAGPCRSPWSVHLLATDLVNGTKAFPLIEHCNSGEFFYITSQRSGAAVDTANDYDVQCKASGTIASGTFNMWGLQCGSSTSQFLGYVDWELFR